MILNYKWTKRFSLITPILIIICIYLGGGGHGLYKPTMVLFPLATLNLAWQDQLSIPFMIVGIFQFIIYGFLIDNTKNKKLVIACILLLHIIMVFIILMLKNPEWR